MRPFQSHAFSWPTGFFHGLVMSLAINTFRNVFSSSSVKSGERGETCDILSLTRISHNDGCADLLATVRRGVGARPTEEEYIEYLLARKKRSQERPPTEYYALEHCLSYQRRVTAIKNVFMLRGKTTPLGVLRDWWDRTDRTRINYRTVAPDRPLPSHVPTISHGRFSGHYARSLRARTGSTDARESPCSHIMLVRAS